MLYKKQLHHTFFVLILLVLLCTQILPNRVNAQTEEQPTSFTEQLIANHSLLPAEQSPLIAPDAPSIQPSNDLAQHQIAQDDPRLQAAMAQLPAEFTQAQSAGDEHWDEQFAPPGIEGTVSAIVTYGNDVYVAGNFKKAGKVAANNIARRDGAAWHPLSTGTSGTYGVVRDMVIKGNELFVVGEFTQAGGLESGNIARWNLQTQQWATLGKKIIVERGYDNAVITTIAVLGNDLYVGGYFDSIDGLTVYNIARWNGTTWGSLGKGIAYMFESGHVSSSGSVSDLEVYAGNLYVGGGFDKIVNQNQNLTVNNIARWNPATQQWSALDAGLSSVLYKVYAMAADEHYLYAGGGFTAAGDITTNGIARWDGNVWSSLGNGVNPYGSVYALVMISGTLYAGGEFSQMDGVANTERLAQWNGASWAAVPGISLASTTRAINVLAAGSTGNLLISGDFSHRLSLLATWNGINWTRFGNGLTHILTKGAFAGYPTEPVVWATAIDDQGNVYIGGEFPGIGGQIFNHIAMWDGKAWYPLDSGVNNPVHTILIVGDAIYVGGEFTQAGSIGANRVAKWDRKSRSWSALGGGITAGIVKTLAIANNMLYAGGQDFPAVQNGSLVAWDGTQWSSNQFDFVLENYYCIQGVCGYTFGSVNSLLIDGGYLWIGGNFDFWREPGKSMRYVANNLAVIELASSKLFLLPSVNDYVNTLAFASDGLYLGGDFTQAGTVAASRIARLDNTGEWYAVGTGVSGESGNGNIFDDPVNSIVVNAIPSPKPYENDTTTLEVLPVRESSGEIPVFH